MEQLNIETYLADLKAKAGQPGPRDERDELVQRIAAFTNPSRVKAGYEPFSDRDIALQLARKHILLNEIRAMVPWAEKQLNPGRAFWGRLKAKK